MVFRTFRGRETAPEPENDAPAREPAVSPTEAFYEQASDDPDEELTGEMFSALDMDVRSQVDAILQSIEGTDPTERQANGDA